MNEFCDEFNVKTFIGKVCAAYVLVKRKENFALELNIYRVVGN